jgi:translocation protein SEC72
MDPDTFNQLPLELDGTTKVIRTSFPDSGLSEELTALNTLHRSLVTAQSDAINAIPPPPTSVNPKRSAQITKLRESGNTSYRQQKYSDAIRMYTLGIEMAVGRPLWEPSVLVREELSGLYANRAQSHMALQNWPEGAVDAYCSVELKKAGNAKAWWRRGKCLMEMGRLEEAEQWISEALEFEGGEQDLVDLMKDIKQAEAKRNS